jgi:hypothetical protein
MARHTRKSLDFLSGDPTPVGAQPSGSEASAAELPPEVVDSLMRIPGVDGVWVEITANGRREVVLYVTNLRDKPAVPRTIQGMPTRVIGGEPIRAEGAR